MIANDIDTRLTEAMSHTQAAADIGLDWNVTVIAPTMPDGRRAILVQLVLSCTSPILGQRLWDVIDCDIDLFSGSPEGMRKLAFDLVQRMQAGRQQAMQVSTVQP